MSERIWQGRCEDCYNQRELQICTDDILLGGMSAELCKSCIDLRKAHQRSGKTPVEIGLFLSGTWIDTAILTIVQRGKRVRVFIKHICDGENAGTVRIRFENQPKWLAGGVFGKSPLLAISEAKHFLRTFYFPHDTIEFV